MAVHEKKRKKETEERKFRKCTKATACCYAHKVDSYKMLGLVVLIPILLAVANAWGKGWWRPMASCAICEVTWKPSLGSTWKHLCARISRVIPTWAIVTLVATPTRIFACFLRENRVQPSHAFIWYIQSTVSLTWRKEQPEQYMNRTKCR